MCRGARAAGQEDCRHENDDTILSGHPDQEALLRPRRGQAVGTVLRRRREAAGVTQDALPFLARVDRAFYGKLERGERQPSVSVLLRIAKALGADGAALLAEAELELSRDWRPDIERGAAVAGAENPARGRRTA